LSDVSAQGIVNYITSGQNPIVWRFFGTLSSRGSNGITTTMVTPRAIERAQALITAIEADLKDNQKAKRDMAIGQEAVRQLKAWREEQIGKMTIITQSAPSTASQPSFKSSSYSSSHINTNDNGKRRLLNSGELQANQKCMASDLNQRHQK
jgi:fructose-specific phosphotransferase system component IIB